MNGLKITQIFFNEVGGSSKLLAFADVVFNDVMTVRGFKIFDSRYGPFVKAPSESYEKDGETKYKDRIGFPDDWYGKDGDNPIFDAVLTEWNDQKGGSKSGGSRKSSGNSGSGRASGEMPF